MLHHPVPDPVAAGQESVWAYPRPPAIRASDAAIVVVLGGQTICETRSSWQILETSHPPTFYLPRSAFAEGSLAPAAGRSFCEWKGQASYLDVRGGQAVASRAAWFYPQPTSPYADLRDHVALYAAAMDYCLVDGERVQAQPGGFYGGWVTSAVSGPFKGVRGSTNW